MSKRLTKEQFIEKVSKIHKGLYTYENTEYTTTKDKVIITCKVHGDFLQKANNHVSGQGCPKCADISGSTKEATEVHKDKYNYDKVVYENNKSLVTIVCPIHGDFKQRASAHISGQGCINCGQTSNFKRSSYIDKAKGRKCIFYTLRCFNEEEVFYKIGITMNKVSDRYNNNKRMPYSYEILKEIYGDAGYIWDLELSEKKRLKQNNYQPLIKFAGSKTECFKTI
jgi:hypothetical protein